jgi:hypothetical protein
MYLYLPIIKRYVIQVSRFSYIISKRKPVCKQSDGEGWFYVKVLANASVQRAAVVFLAICWTVIAILTILLVIKRQL